MIAEIPNIELNGLETADISPTDCVKMFDQSLISPEDSFEKPPVIFQINGADYGTLGNISMATGKAKSRKSMFVAYLTSRAMLIRHNVLYFDTEQGDYHCWLQSKRIAELSSGKGSVKYSALRRYMPTERIQIIERAIYNESQCKLVVIDGVADLLNGGVNDESEAIAVTGKLMKWSQELNIHIITILHQNKSDNHSKGHIGSQLNQKCETVISVTKDPLDENKSKVESVFNRGIGIDPFSFAIDEFGIPYLTDNSESGEVKKLKRPFDFEKSKNREIVMEVFENNKGKEIPYKELIQKIKYVLSKYDIQIGDSICRDWITYFKEQNMIHQDREKKPYKLV